MFDDDYLGKYMAECPKCGHRYNKKLHGNKCPDCGYRKGVGKFVPYIIVVVFFVLLLMGVSVTDAFERIIYDISHSNFWYKANDILNIVNPVYILIGINVVLFICGFNGDKADAYGNSYQDTIGFKEYYRLLTSGFTHSNIIHIALNMFSLYNLGIFVYNKVGALLFLLIYFVCLLLGGLFSVLIHHMFDNDYIYSIGASGAVCGLLGFYVVYIIKLQIDPMQSIQYIYKALLPLLITAFNPNIDNIGHLTGLLVGVVLSFILVNSLTYVSINSDGNNSQTILTNRETENAVKVMILDDKYVEDFAKYTVYVESEETLNSAVNECLQIMADQNVVYGESVSIQGHVLDRVTYINENVVIGQEKILSKDELKEFLLYGNNDNPTVTFVIVYSGYNNGEYFEKTFYNGVEQ